jgi:hypothetical protein
MNSTKSNWIFLSNMIGSEINFEEVETMLSLMGVSADGSPKGHFKIAGEGIK